MSCIVAIYAIAFPRAYKLRCYAGMNACGEDKYIALTIRKIGRKYRLEVSDHGPGIKPEELPHVWERYYKTSTNYVRETSGTGLGLSIVKEILMLHNANYGVESKVGQGSTFWFELDMVKKERK